MRMGAKYLPTIKDRKANLRFQERQSMQSQAKKAPAALPARKSKQK